MNDPGAGREAIDEKFSREHFGVGDPKLARIPLLLGSPVVELLESAPQFQPRDGSWPGAAYDWREARIRADLQSYERQRPAQQSALRQAAALLGLARPRTDRQRERVRLWRWALDVLAQYARFARRWPIGAERITARQLTRWREEAMRLQAATPGLLARIYTARTMRDEQQARFGVHIDWLDGETARRSGRGEKGAGRASVQRRP
jgi:hypothetical protein